MQGNFVSNDFVSNVKSIVKRIKEEVYVKDEILERLVTLLLSLKEGKYRSKEPPRGILFYGPPGTGKTLLMKTLAEHLGLKEKDSLIIVRGPEIMSKYYGSSERRLREIFRQAREKARENGLAVIFIDEIDSIAPRRDAIRRELEQRLVGQLLTLMDGLEKRGREGEAKGHVIVIGSTNRPEAIDPALRRPGRFDLEVEFDPPDFDGRKEILKILLEKIAEVKREDIEKIEKDLDKIAERTVGYTGADLRQLINEALLIAMLEGRGSISAEDLSKAINYVKPSALREFNIEKPRDMLEEIRSSMDPDTQKRIEEKMEEILSEFRSKCGFTAVLIYPSLFKVAYYIASTLAYRACGEKCVYIVARASQFRSRWFGETEYAIRSLFNRVKRATPAAVYIEGFEAIVDTREENLRGAVVEVLDHLDELRRSNAEVLLVCSTLTPESLDRVVEGYFNYKIGEDRI